MRRLIVLSLIVLALLCGVGYAQFGGNPMGTGPCAFGIGPFGDCNPSADEGALLMEDGGHLLLETGGKLLLE